MKQPCLSLLLVCLGVALAKAQTNFALLTREHTDGLCILFRAGAVPPLELIAWQRDLNADYRSNEVIFAVKEQGRLTLPAGTPFGDAGQPMWILPQTQDPNLLFLGVNSERVPLDTFNGPLSIRLVRFSGPGYFMMWQATGPGQFTVRVDSRDGLDASDALMPLIGSHEHFNWGFSATGVYCTTWQVSGQRAGETTNIASAETTFVFHVQPLPPATNFLTWQKSFWPPGFNPPTTLRDGNPDGDQCDNLLEYALAANPTNPTPATALPCLSFVTLDGLQYGALAFTHYLPALDLDYRVEATSGLPGGWAALTNVFSTVPGTNGLTELLTIRDTLPTTHAQRFYRLRVNLH
jgi:surface-anchored protein